jgi:hypothetical protein
VGGIAKVVGSARLRKVVGTEGAGPRRGDRPGRLAKTPSQSQPFCSSRAD